MSDPGCTGTRTLYWPSLVPGGPVASSWRKACCLSRSHKDAMAHQWPGAGVKRRACRAQRSSAPAHCSLWALATAHGHAETALVAISNTSHHCPPSSISQLHRCSQESLLDLRSWRTPHLLYQFSSQDLPMAKAGPLGRSLPRPSLLLLLPSLWENTGFVFSGLGFKSQLPPLIKVDIGQVSECVSSSLKYPPHSRLWGSPRRKCYIDVSYGLLSNEEGPGTLPHPGLPAAA